MFIGDLFVSEDREAQREALEEMHALEAGEESEAGSDNLEMLAEFPDKQAPAIVSDDGVSLSLIELAQILDEHKSWVESNGEAGVKADLTGVNLAGAELTGVNLQNAVLTKVNLTGADLSMANLRGANLVHADLRNAIMLGTELRGADLMGATLYGAEGLWAGRLGGTNLFDAVLPESVAEFNSTQPIAQASKVARWFYFATLAISALCCLLIVFTNDVRLLLNSSALPGSHSANVLPMTGFYLGGPLLLFFLYLRFHFLLLRLWGSMAALPAVFPDGQTPERDGPWFLMGLIRKHFRWLRDGGSPLSILETAVTTALGYWVVPATLVLFWTRYLVRQDFRGTLLQVLLITVSVATATSLPTIVSLVLRPGDVRIPQTKNLFGLLLLSTRAALIAGGFLLLVSLGVNRGMPADRDSAPQHSAAHIGRWASQIFQSVGYRPYADLTEAVISTPPEHNNWTEEGMAAVPGARLNQMHLRYARAYRAFLMNAKFWRADMEGAYFSEADLRGANLREAMLRSSNFDRAQANRAVFVSVNAERAKFVSTDLRGADLSYGNFDNANFSNAKLSGASMYAVSMRGAELLRTDLGRTDMRDAKLDKAVFSFANLQDADLSSAKLAGANFTGAKLKGTILLDADLKNADFRGASLSGTLLRGAELDGANLTGAELRGVVGLSAAQICSARWQGGQFDAEMLVEVQSKCGAGGSAIANVTAAQTTAAQPAAVITTVPAQNNTAMGNSTPAIAAPTAAAAVNPKPDASANAGEKSESPAAVKSKPKAAASVNAEQTKAKQKPSAEVNSNDAKQKQKTAVVEQAKVKQKTAAPANTKAKSAAGTKPQPVE
jgi:uncharacterized protein YjbI with pentapeptide repeats